MIEEAQPVKEYRERLQMMLALKKLRQRKVSFGVLPVGVDSAPDDQEDYERQLIARLDERKPSVIMADSGAKTGVNFLQDILEALQFHDLNLDAFMLCVYLHEHPGFYQLCDLTFGDSYPRMNQRRFLEDVLYEYHGKPARTCFNDSSPLLQEGLLRYKIEREFLPARERTVFVNEVWLDFLLGKKNSLQSIKFRENAMTSPEPYQGGELLELVLSSVNSKRQSNSGGTFHIFGPTGSGKRRLVRFLCSQATLASLEIDLSRFAREFDVESQLRSIIRAAAANERALLIHGADIVTQDSFKNLGTLLNEELAREGLYSFVVSERKLEFTNNIKKLTSIELKYPNRLTREHIWNEIIADYTVAPDLSVKELARIFHITGSSIRDALREAEGIAGPGGSIKQSELLRICRSKSTSRLSALAFPVEPKFGWEDLVLPSHTSHLIREIEADIRADDHIFDTWRMDRVATAAKGHNILFSGIPGTGKTMAASIIAAELGVELYKVDLSRVSSKYVGEVEKNLAALFDEAEKANAALFFDEADSLFGKRGSNESAQGHYVNQQVGYLLQRLEEFKGITFMATNLPENIDHAFERRFTHVVRFNYPDEEQRLRLWQKSFSPETPLADDVDFPLLAHEFECTGAHIKAIALRAARRAAGDEKREVKAVTRFDIIYGTVREFDKVKPGWGVGYKDAFQDDIAKVRAMISSPDDLNPRPVPINQVRPEDLDWGPEVN